MYSLLSGLAEGLSRSETWLGMFESLLAPEEVAGAPLPLAAQMDFVANEIAAGAVRVQQELGTVPEQVRFHATAASNTIEDTVAAIRRNLPEGYTEPFAPEIEDTVQFWHNLPNFGSEPLLGDVEHATLLAPPLRTRARTTRSRYALQRCSGMIAPRARMRRN